MTKDKKPTMFDDIQWGNQELDGLSHDDIMNTNWNKKRNKAEREHLSQMRYGKALPKKTRKKVQAYLKGKKKSAETVKKASKKLTGRTLKRGRRVMTPKGEFAKIKLAAEAYGVTDMAIKNRITNPKHPDFYFLDDINSLGAQKVHTDKGKFNNVIEAAEAVDLTVNGLKHRIASEHWPEFYYLEERSEFISPQIKVDKDR